MTTTITQKTLDLNAMHSFLQKYPRSSDTSLTALSWALFLLSMGTIMRTPPNPTTIIMTLILMKH